MFTAVRQAARARRHPESHRTPRSLSVTAWRLVEQIPPIDVDTSRARSVMWQQSSLARSLVASMTQTTSSGAPQLHDQILGRVIEPGQIDYDDARRLWNADFDRRPAMIVRCQGADDVATAVRYAVAEGLEIAVRCGAHSMSGQSALDDGMVIDLSDMSDVTVDPIDNLVSAETVIADGSIRRVSQDEEPDLFWAIRGGGGNFGVMPEFEFRLHEVNPTIQLGMLFWTLDQGAEMLRMARDVVAGLPLDVNVVVGSMKAPPEPFVPAHLQIQPGFIMVVVGFGGAESPARVVEEIRNRMQPAFEFATPMPYVGLQQMLDKANDWGFYCYDKGCYVEDITDGVIDVLTEHMPKKLSPLSLVPFYRLDGAYLQVSDDATAFSGGRTPRYGVFMIAVCPAPDMLPPERLDPRPGRGAAPPHHRCGLLRQWLRGVRRRPRQSVVRPRQVRAPHPNQGAVRPSQRLASQRQHQAGFRRLTRRALPENAEEPGPHTWRARLLACRARGTYLLGRGLEDRLVDLLDRRELELVATDQR
jgi:hypothetical protein